MPFSHTTAFGTTNGNLTDNERLQAQQGAQLAAIQAEIADRQAGRQFEGGQADKTRQFQTGLDQSATARAFGLADRQMAPAMMGAQLDQTKFNEGADVRNMRNQFQANILRQAIGQAGQGGAGSAAPGADPSDMMFLAFGGNPAELAQNKRLDSQAKLAREDSLEGRQQTTATALLQSTNPQARALGAAMLSKIPNSGLGGMDTSTLQSALMPQVDAGKAAGGSLAISGAVDQLAKELSDASSDISGPEAGIASGKMKIDAVVKQMVNKGVPEEEARAYVMNELKKRLPTASFWNHPISGLIDTLVPGTPLEDRSNPSRVRTGIGLPTN